jgi:hypothetical protein
MKKVNLLLLFALATLFISSSFSVFKVHKLVWVEFCNPGSTGVCEIKQGGGAGFHCEFPILGSTPDCSGSHWVDL